VTLGFEMSAPAATSHAPQVAGIGIDLLEIGRLEQALARRPRLAERLFTEAERSYAAGRARPGQHLAARFCAKEAVAKALGLESWSFRDVEVLSAGHGPRVHLSGAAAERATALRVRVEVSLTHNRRDAAAVAIAAAERS
jgi:holo-[acyl-carrier protein] synthase